MNKVTQYDRIQVTLHWLIALIILFMIGLGLYMVGLPKKSELPIGQESVRAFYFLMHKSLGMTVLALILVRIVWRLTHKVPEQLQSISKWQQRAASSVHFLLYMVMLGMPLSGYLQSIFSKYDTKWWGVVMPRIAEADAAMRANFTTVHEVFAFLFIALIGIHVLAAIKHRLNGTEVSRRMSFKRIQR